MADCFADSYGLVALLAGERRYARIFQSEDVVTSAMNVLEVYATLLRKVPPSEARAVAIGLLGSVIEVPTEVAFSAAEFRQRMRARRRDCSYIDAWGYAAARHFSIPFLTGDSAFEGIDGVRFLR